MKLIQTIHRASGHSAKVFYCETGGFYVAVYYYKSSEVDTLRYKTQGLQDCIDTAQLELMILQDQDSE